MRKALPLVLLAGAALLFCVGIVALASNFYFGRNQNADLTIWKSPLTLVDGQKIKPVDALESLSGVADANAVDDALTQGDWESALALVAYSPDLPDTSRAGTLLLLGSRYAAGKENVKAAWCYQYAVMLALLSPMPSDLTRTQTLLEAGQGLRALGNPSTARAAIDQAYLIAVYSATLPREPRASVLQQIAQGYQDLGQAGLATQARHKSEEASTLTSEAAVDEAHTPFRIQPSGLPDDPELKTKTKARTTAVRQLIDELNATSSKTLPQEKIAAVGDKLYDEDGTRMNFYEAQYKAAADPSAQAAVLRDKIRWLALKLRVAGLGFGVSLVPEWETDTNAIGKALNDAYDQLFQLYEQQAGAAAKPQVADRQVEDVLRTELLMGRWGLYRDYDQDALRAQLGEISQRLRDEQVASLRLDSYVRANQVNYLLVPDELYSQGEKALPR